jgi:glycerophosphoryl diester phosphodiesterase
VSPTHAFLDYPGPIPFAHRGGAEVHPENTIVAFAAAVAIGYRYLETDVHVTSDGVLIAFHDDRLDRVTDRQGIVAALPWAEVSRARVAGREPIVLFDDLLSAFPTARINVEPKHDAAVAPLVASIEAARAVDRVCIGSFSDRRVAAVRVALGSAACTSLGSLEIAALRFGSWGGRRFLERVRNRPGRCVQIPVAWRGIVLAERRLIDAAHDMGLPVHVWTVNEPAEMTRLLDLGVDGLMTDRPRVLRDILVARDEWREAPSPG